MMAPVYCERCEAMTHPTLPHSCFSAATLRTHKEAEQKVIAAAKAWAYSEGSEFGLEESEKLFSAVNALRALEEDA
jgi:hypothetical protein